MSSSSSPCAACKIQRRKCTQECVFAPYFPPDQPTKFANVHRVFGASNVSKLLQELSASQREDAVNSLHFEAEQRIADPVYGCVGSICLLQQRLKHLQLDLEAARHELAQYIGPQALIPMAVPPPQNNPHGLVPRQGFLQPPPPPLQHGMFPMMRPGQPQQQHNVYEAQQQQLAAIAVAQQQQEMYATYEQMQQQQLLRLYGQRQQQEQEQEHMRFNSTGGFEASSSENAQHGFLNQVSGLDLGNYDQVQAYHHMHQQQQQQQPGPQQLGEQGINLNQQEEQLGDLGLNLNQQHQDVNQLEAQMFLEPLGPPQSLQPQLGHRRSKSDEGFDPTDDC